MSRTKARVTIIVDENMCKDCGLCMAACPRRAIASAKHTNTRGFHPASLIKPDDCTGCAQCALMCPDACIKIVSTE